jgi:hypothetical protein
LNPDRCKVFFLFSKRHKPALGPTQLRIIGYSLSFPGVKRLWREVDHSSPSGAEVKNEWPYTRPSCVSSLCDRDNFTVFRTLMLCVLPRFPRFNHTSNQGSTYFPKTKETSPNSRRKQDDMNATSIARSHSRGVACGTHRCDLCGHLSRSAQCMWTDNAFLYVRKKYSFPYYI